MKIYESNDDYSIYHISISKKDLRKLLRGEDINSEVINKEGHLVCITSRETPNNTYRYH